MSTTSTVCTASLVTLMLLATVDGQKSTAASVAAPPQFAAARARILKAINNRETPSLAIAVIQNDGLVWSEAFGLADLETRKPATINTVYGLGSITKTFTATGVMMLVDAGVIGLDMPANAYLKREKLRAFVGDANDITIRRMLNHTSGLYEGYNFFYPGTPTPTWDETIRRYGFAVSRPGTRRVYANHAYGILGYITETVSGTPWIEFLRQRLFKPLGMHHTGIRLMPNVEAHAAGQYNIGVGRTFLRVPTIVSDTPGAGEMRSSLNDLITWVRLHLNDGVLGDVRILRTETARAMRRLSSEDQPGTGIGNGLGWSVETYLDRVSFGHAGGMPGVSTQLRAFAAERGAFIILTNAGAHELVAEIVKHLTRELAPSAAGRAPAHLPQPASPTNNVAPFVGTWVGTVRHIEGDYQVRLAVGGDGAVSIQFNGHEMLKLKDLTFKDSLNGTVQALIPTQPGYPNVPDLQFVLERDGDRLIGVCKAYAYRQFGLPHWVELRRSSPSSQ